MVHGDLRLCIEKAGKDMAVPIPEERLQDILRLVGTQPDGMGFGTIKDALQGDINRRTLQNRLQHLVERKRLITQGKGRWLKYRLPLPENSVPESEIFPLSKDGISIQSLISRPLTSRKIVGFNRNFLESYTPNKTFYLSQKDRTRLKTIGTAESGEQPAGTYARQILDRFLIDLSWNSSRLEGNTYSLLDTKELIDFGKVAIGKDQQEAQMILNHKYAIEYLVESADDIGFNRRTILNLHGILANNLLADHTAAGRLRRIAVGIEKSTFRPLETPQLIEECFNLLMVKAQAIEDPFEQSFFSMVHLPYLQPFDDVNKRVSRLASNIPFIKANLSPLAFTDVPRELYTQAILGVYELNRIELLRDIYLWAYQRSVDNYRAVRQSLGDPDPFRLKYRNGLGEVVNWVVTKKYTRAEAWSYVLEWSARHIPDDDQERFVRIAQDELKGLHEGNFARYRIRPSEFDAWHEKWAKS